MWIKATFLSLLFIVSVSLFSQANYRMEFEFDNYENDTLLLAYYYADRQLIRDTIFADDQDRFIYEGRDTVPTGVYILMFFPEKEYIQLIINEKEPFMTVKGDYNDLSEPSFTGSKDNEMFYSYLRYIKEKRQDAEKIALDRTEAIKQGQDSTKYDRFLDQIDEDVLAYQNKLIEEEPESVTSMLILGNREVKIPDFDAKGEELQKRRFYYYRDHYFDHIDLGNPAVLKTPFLHNKLERYLDNLTVQMPDSIILSVDHLLKQMEPAIDTWKFYVAHFLNKYAKNNIIGMDAVYVHMVDSYYAVGRTPWADEETLKKIIDNAEKMKPVLIGKIAPDVTIFTEDEQAVRLHDIESEYTILIFWAPDCGHCKKSMPSILEFDKEYREKGVTTVAICTKHMDKTDSCWEFVKEKGMDSLAYNLADKYHRSRFQVKYNVRTTPQTFILDKDKKIILKKVATEKLGEVMKDVLEMDKVNKN